MDGFWVAVLTDGTVLHEGSAGASAHRPSDTLRAIWPRLREFFVPLGGKRIVVSREKGVISCGGAELRFDAAAADPLFVRTMSASFGAGQVNVCVERVRAGVVCNGEPIAFSVDRSGTVVAR